jgi:hypothetical protein
VPRINLNGIPEVTYNPEKREHQKLRWVFPSNRKKTLQAKLHNDSIKMGLAPNYVINDSEDYVMAARKIFHR